MKPGRELDALVAEKVMGHQVDRDFPDVILGPTDFELKDGKNRILASYSTDISAAWEVVEKLILEKGWFSLSFYPKTGLNPHADPAEAHWSVSAMGLPYKIERPRADTAPHVICLAALKAVGHDPA